MEDDDAVAYGESLYLGANGGDYPGGFVSENPRGRVRPDGDLFEVSLDTVKMFKSDSEAAGFQL